MKWSHTLALFSCVIGASTFLTSEVSMKNGSVITSVIRFAYLSSFSTCFGASIWVTFVGGIIMFQNLPRHQFGNLQSKLFPAYFSLVTVSSAICLASFSFLCTWKPASPTERFQIFAISTTFVAGGLNLLILEPLTSSAMKARHKVEKELGIGSEIGGKRNWDLARANPELKKANKYFGILHGLSSLANLASLGGIGAHIWYVSQKIEI